MYTMKGYVSLQNKNNGVYSDIAILESDPDDFDSVRDEAKSVMDNTDDFELIEIEKDGKVIWRLDVSGEETDFGREKEG